MTVLEHLFSYSTDYYYLENEGNIGVIAYAHSVAVDR